MNLLGPTDNHFDGVTNLKPQQNHADMTLRIKSGNMPRICTFKYPPSVYVDYFC